MKSMVLSVLLGVGLIPNVIAQSFDAVSYHPNADTVGYYLIDFIQSPMDSGYVLIGNGVEQVPPYANTSHFMKTDKSGDVMWAKQIVGGIENSMKSIVQSPNGFFINGYFPGGSGVSSLVEIDNNGDVLWSKNYTDPSQQRLFDKLVNISGGLLNIGRAASQSVGCLKTDNSGDISWQNDYSLSQLTSVQVSIGFTISTTDGGALIGVNYIEQSNPPFRWGAALLKIGSNGTLSWSKTVDSGDIDQVRTAFEESNGDFIIGGVSQDGNSTYDATLHHFNSAGTLIASKKIGSDNGSIRFVSKEGNNYAVTTSQNAIIRLDPSFEVLQSKVLKSYYDLEKSIFGLSGEIVSGHRFLVSSSPYYIYDYGLTQTNSNLGNCLDSTITVATSTVVATATSFSSAITATNLTVSTTSVMPISIQTTRTDLCSPNGIHEAIADRQQSFEVYPNPSNGLCQLTAPVECDEYQLFNSLGKLVKQGSITRSVSHFDLLRHPAGVYVLKLVKGNKIVGTERVILH